MNVVAVPSAAMNALAGATRGLVALVTMGSAVAVAVLTVRSLGWPLAHDASIMHYVAWLLAQGAVPYRDAFDMNAPGVYLVHWALMTAAGSGDLAWRIFDLAWLGATVAVLVAFCRPLGGAWPSVGAATLFALYHLSGGAWRVGQRDFLLCGFLLGGAGLVASGLERGVRPRRLLAAGLCLGAGMMVKPHAGLYWAAALLVAAWGARRAGQPPLPAAGAVFAGGLLIPMAALAWLEAQGALQPFRTIVGDYLLPLYSQVGRDRALEAISWYDHGVSLWTLLGALGIVAILTPVAPRLEGRKALALLGVLYGALHFVLQGKGWEYHLYPLALFLAALVPVTVGGRGPQRGVLALLAVGLWGALVLVLLAKGLPVQEEAWITRKVARVGAMTRDLQRLVPDGATVQVMDTTDGGIHALLRLRIRQPTRFIYDFHFFHHERDPRIQGLRAEFMAGLAARPPAAMLLLQDDWIRPGYERLGTFPELAAWLERGYRLAVEGDGYRIYAPRPGP
jgi:hypothetical protein